MTPLPLSPTEQADALRLFLRLPALHAAPGSLIEVRYRHGDGMRQRFIPATDVEAAGELVQRLGEETDVDIGVVARTREAGGRDALGPVSLLWADCDGPKAVEVLAAFTPAPSVIVGTGTGSNCHAYWPLTEPITATEAERLNRRLAARLGADSCSSDAARILRPPFTLNHKTDTPKPVTLDRFEIDTHLADDVAGALPDPKPERAQPSHRRNADPDPLREIPTVDYVECLAGVEVSRSRTIRCPLPDHDDRTPSFHLYDEGWYCHGCERGGSIYDLAGYLHDLPPRGSDFRSLRRLLLGMFG